jgi:NADH-quinone oxidoreductase subunit E
MFSSELRRRAEEIVGRYPHRRSALLPLLHLVQAQDGYVSDDGVAECAELLGLTRAEVGAVATFYTMYKREPLGEHLVSVCTNFSCKVRGAQDVYERLSKKLGVTHNETTADGKFTLEHAECLGNCEGAPIVSVDYMNYECLTPDAAEELLDAIAGGTVPQPTRGFASPGIRDIEHRLAGAGPRDGIPVGRAGDQARATDGAVPQPASGPGAASDAVQPEFTGDPRPGAAADDTAPESLAEESGTGAGSDYGGASDTREDPTDPGQEGPTDA